MVASRNLQTCNALVQYSNVHSAQIDVFWHHICVCTQQHATLGWMVGTREC